MADRLILVSSGNSRTRVALAVDGELEPSRVFENEAMAEIVSAVAGHLEASRDVDQTRVVLATVNRPATDDLEERLRKPATAADATIVRFGRGLDVSMQQALAADSGVGQDRLLDALGAFIRSRQACVVVDAGTAITVDFVDGEGTFHGGAIAPGVRMMARALNEFTSGLPRVDVAAEAARLAERSRGADEPALSDEDAAPVANPLGKKTSEAITVGVLAAARGMVRHLIDKYAEFYRGYPRVVATGGDAPLLFKDDEIVEAIVPDLALVGMLEAVNLLRTEMDDEEEE